MDNLLIGVFATTDGDIKIAIRNGISDRMIGGAFADLTQTLNKMRPEAILEEET